MKLNASRSRKQRAAFAAIGSVVVVATLGAGSSRAQGAAAAPAASPAPEAFVNAGANPFADRFPNLVLKTHEGKTVRFYDDLLAGKIVMINFMYATCKGR
jgi:cytochrome oxidase Cu insertion factor (SCO1/SenC/PrrC family)